MATAATSSFTDVQRYLRQRRATGQVTDPRSEKLAWQAYYDSLAANRAQSAAIGARNRQLELEEERLDIANKAQDNAQSAAKIRGVTELGSTAVLGGMLLKDTELGATMGLGKPGSAVSPRSAVPVGAVGAAPSTGTYAAPSLAKSIPAVPTSVGGPATIGTTNAAAPGFAAGGSATGAAALTGATAASSAGFGAIGGLVGGAIGGKIGGQKGSVIGGVAAGAGAGAVAAGPYGAIIGGVVGGLGALVSDNK